jgi:glycosyltransferase involved in cell wall biosynthesis
VTETIQTLEASRTDPSLHCSSLDSSSGSVHGDTRKVLLISNRVMHYRVPVYNYFHRRFCESGYEFSVLADELSGDNQKPIEFGLQQLPFDFLKYRKVIRDLRPAAVILFLHMKDRIIWPLIHWLKVRRIPFAFWTKGGNWDDPDSRLKYCLFNYIHALSDGLILYSTACKNFIHPRFHAKAFVANNTLNFESFPRVAESKEEIKRELGIPFAKTVLFMGNMAADSGRKRVDHLIEIFRNLQREDVGLVLVGPGMSPDLQRRLNPRNTRYFGNLQDPEDRQINRLCKMADLCAIPGHVGLGLNQAFYWGLPVITEEGHHPPEIAYLKPGRNGFIVPSGALAAFEQRMLEVLDNDEFRAELSRNAALDIRNDASPEIMFQGFHQCVERLAGEQNHGRH